VQKNKQYTGSGLSFNDNSNVLIFCAFHNQLFTHINSKWVSLLNIMAAAQVAVVDPEFFIDTTNSK
jgi:hypothetical protein